MSVKIGRAPRSKVRRIGFLEAFFHTARASPRLTAAAYIVGAWKGRLLHTYKLTVLANLVLQHWGKGCQQNA